MITILSDEEIGSIADRIDFRGAIEAAFVRVARREGASAPVLRVPGPQAGQALNLKFGSSDTLVGGKIGSYWAGNASRGLVNHEATTILFDAQTGYPRAFVAARLLNRLRTATADAVAVDLLARRDAKRLALVGSGAQAPFEAWAIAEVRALDAVWICARRPEAGEALAAALEGVAPVVSARPIEDACREADIVVTVTASTSAVIDAAWIQPGTHVSAMGADAVGKQELPVELFERARVFADLPSQSVVIGECQHPCTSGHLDPDRIVALGDVITCSKRGRTGRNDITIFDSSGIAIQDLCVAQAALEVATEAGLGTAIRF